MAWTTDVTTHLMAMLMMVHRRVLTSTTIINHKSRSTMCGKLIINHLCQQRSTLLSVVVEVVLQRQAHIHLIVIAI